MKDQPRIAVIGLGYVGLPLARLFATKYPVIGYDINIQRVEQLQKGYDSTLEVEDEKLQAVLVKSIYELHKQPVLELAEIAEIRHPELVSGSEEEKNTGLYVTSDLGEIADCNYYIITVPTPIDKNNRPDLTPLYKSSESVGEVLKKGDIVIYESTVYPGVTEDECVPVLERVSGLKFNEDFFVGYS
ncbi:MAG: hypothetical protein R3213_09440, partial [Flavobacteriaceae bacterium]|nr:hypothetical protein [Flavobacteriaceae bacterium]